MMKIGTIHVTRKVDGFNQPHDSVRFEGEVFFIDKYLLWRDGIKVNKLEEGQRIVLFGTPLILISKRGLEFSDYAFMRAGRFITYLCLFANPIVRTSKLIYRRIILTLCVWNLGQYTEGDIPSFKWIVKKWKK